MVADKGSLAEGFVTDHVKRYFDDGMFASLMWKTFILGAISHLFVDRKKIYTLVFFAR